MAKQCGAKTRAGGCCKAPAMKNGRCRVHGGSSTGAPKENKNAIQHGIYSRFLSEEEIEISNNLSLGSIDDELRLTKIRLMRVLNRESEFQFTAELDEEIEREGGRDVANYEAKKKVRDYAGLIDKLTARIQSLERDRAALLDAQLNAELKRAEIQKNSFGKDGDDMTRDDTFISPDEPIPNAPIL